MRADFDKTSPAQPEKRTEERTETHGVCLDVIDRQEAIDALDALCDRECEYSKKERSLMCGACHLGSAFDVIEQLPPAQPEQRSFSCDQENDLISRQAAINIVEFECGEWRGLARTIVEAIKQLPTAQPDWWIPCSEKLPEEDKRVLVAVYFMGLKQTHPNGWNYHIKPSYYVDIASYIDGEWNSALDEYKIARNRHKVLAWMPLPEPYREEGDE